MGEALPIPVWRLGGPVIKGFGRGSKLLGIPTGRMGMGWGGMGWDGLGWDGDGMGWGGLGIWNVPGMLLGVWAPLLVESRGSVREWGKGVDVMMFFLDVMMS